MTIEEAVFVRKRFLPQRMEPFGFRKQGDGFTVETDLLNGDFHAVLTVSARGEASGTVLDRVGGEEYAPLRMERMNGAYVNSVRAAYTDWLNEIASACCRDVPFLSDQANRIAALIRDRYAVEPDFPWSKDPYSDAGVFRHPENGKWFALIMTVRRAALQKDGSEGTLDAINLKIVPENGESLRQLPGVYPAYHMNHTQWISAALDERLTDDALLDLIDTSFRLTL